MISPDIVDFITSAELEILEKEGLIPFLREFRGRTGLGLPEAKKIGDHLCAKFNLVPYPEKKP